MKSESLQVDLNLKDGKISFSTLTGEPLLGEKDSGTAFTDFNDAGVKTFSVTQSFILDKDEAIYGLGQQQQGKMEQRNDTLHMIEGNTDDYIPFFQSVKGYGVFWDNYSPTWFLTIQRAHPSSRTSAIVSIIILCTAATLDGVIALDARFDRPGSHAAIVDIRLLAK